MKKEIRDGIQKAHDAVAIDEETKNCLIKQGREEARASLMKSSPFQILRQLELHMFLRGVLLTDTVSRARCTYCATALLGINQFCVHER